MKPSDHWSVDGDSYCVLAFNDNGSICEGDVEDAEEQDVVEGCEVEVGEVCRLGVKKSAPGNNYWFAEDLNFYFCYGRSAFHYKWGME